MDNNKPWTAWYKATPESNYIPDNFGITKKRAEEIQESIGTAMKRINSSENLKGDAETMFLQTLDIAKITTPSEFGLLFFYLGQLHQLVTNDDKKESSAQVAALTAVIVEMGKVLAGTRTRQGDIEQLKKAFGDGNVHAIKVPADKAGMVFKTLKELEKFVSEDDEDDVDKLLKEVAGKSEPDKVN